jgi:pimeloyl-ACP methyl ester carboxylesterase
MIIFIVGMFPAIAWAIKPDTVHIITPYYVGLMYKDIWVRTSDGISLHAWFTPAQELPEDTMLYYANNPKRRKYLVDESLKKPTIIICNGDAANMSYQVPQVANLCKNGYNVVTFDWRGFGKSQYWEYGKDIVCEEFITDYNAVLDSVIHIQGVDSSRIGAFGFSTGAYIAFLEFALRNEIKAVALRGMFTSYSEVAVNLKKLYEKENIDSPLTYPEIFDQKYNAIDLAKTVVKPLFLIVGEDDERCPPEMSIKLLNQTNSFVRDLWIVKGARHGGWYAPEVINSDGFRSRLVNFFDDNL